MPADRAFRNGVIFTADGGHRVAEALAIRSGRIVYVGDRQGLETFVGKTTRVTDLKGGFLMPGLVDGHLHPLEAGRSLIKCNLNYATLTVQELQRRVQACLDQTRAREPDGWLEVVEWFQEGMRPAGVRTGHATLDALHTRRPIIVRSSFGHTVLANARALSLAGVTAATPDPLGGKIWHDEHGAPDGLLEDAAFAVFDTLLPAPTPAQDIHAAAMAQQALNRQGVTSFLDADAAPEDQAAFSALAHAHRLSVRAHLAVLIRPTEADDPAKAVAGVLAARARHDGGALKPVPGVTVRNAKLFLDGVIAAPAMTGAVLEPYRRNAGTADHPDWQAGTSTGPPVYFAPAALADILVRLGRAGIDPHLHTDGDGAVRAGLDAIEALRKALPGADIRPALAHCEIVSAQDLPRFKTLDAMPVISLQWGKPAGDTLGLRDYFGPERMKVLEPAGLLAGAGAPIAFGSDWPVDALDEWFAFKVGVTRTNAPDAGSDYVGRLGDDPGLSAEAVLRAATIDAAHELHEDDVTGSLEVGKFADLIVLDRNPLTIPAEGIAGVKVLETLVGGRSVYRAGR